MLQLRGNNPPPQKKRQISKGNGGGFAKWGRRPDFWKHFLCWCGHMWSSNDDFRVLLNDAGRLDDIIYWEFWDKQWQICWILDVWNEPVAANVPGWGCLDLWCCWHDGNLNVWSSDSSVCSRVWFFLPFFREWTSENSNSNNTFPQSSFHLAQNGYWDPNWNSKWMDITF